MIFKNTIEFSQTLDSEDKLRQFRDRFFIPLHNGKECVYFTGNSLGLQPKTTGQHVNQELEDWARLGVEGHFHAKNPWYSYHEIFPSLLTDLVGGLPEEGHFVFVVEQMFGPHVGAAQLVELL